MSSATRIPYQRLKQEKGLLEDDGCYEGRQRIVVRSRSWYKLRKVHIRKRFRLKVPSLGKYLRRKIRQVSAARVSWAKLLKRLKEGQGHFGDLFAGNYLFMQVNPPTLKQFEKIYHRSGLDLSGLPSRYSLPRISQI